MASPPSRIGSKTQGLNALARDSKNPDWLVKDSNPQAQSGLPIDSKSLTQLGLAENTPQAQNGLVEERKSLTQLGLAEERKSLTRLGVAEERKSLTQPGLAEQRKSLTQLGLPEERKSLTQLGLAEQRKSLTQLGLPEERKSLTQLGVAEQRKSLTQLGVAEQRKSLTQLGVAEERKSLTQLGLAEERKSLTQLGGSEQRKSLTQFGLAEERKSLSQLGGSEQRKSQTVGLAEEHKFQIQFRSSDEQMDIKDWVESQLAVKTSMEMKKKVLEDEESFMGQKTEEPSSPLPGALWAETTLFKQPADNELQDLKEPVEEKRRSVTETPQRLETKKSNLVSTLEKLEERRQTLTETLAALEERRKTLMETLDGLEERRKTLMEIPEGLEERRKILVETLEGLEEKRKTLMESSEGLEEKKKILMESLEGLEERRKTLTELTGLEERRKTTIEISDITERPEERKRSLRKPSEPHPSDDRRTKSFHGYPLAHKVSSKKSKTDTRRVPSKPVVTQPKIITRYLPQKPKPQTADKSTQLRAIPIFPLRLPVATPSPSKEHPKVDAIPSVYENGTQIASSFERLMMRPPPPLFKRKRSKTKSISSIFSSSSSSSGSKGGLPVCCKGSRNSNRSLEWILRQKCCVIERGDRPFKKCHLFEGGPRSMKRQTPERAIRSHSRFKPIERPLRSHSKYSAIDRASQSQSRASAIERPKRSHSRLSAIERATHSHSKLSAIERATRSRSRSSAIERATNSHSKLSAIERATHSRSKSSAVERPSCSETKRKGSQIVYNFYVNLCDCCKEEEPCIDYVPCNYEECVPCAGLSRACNLFSTLKAGAIEVTDLLMALHALGILVTHDEMQETLKCVEMQDGNVNFGEFLEVVNQSSPFAETDALQNTVRAFRKIKNGMVNFSDLETVLGFLGVEMSHGDIRRILKSPQVCKIDMVDLSEFFDAARVLDYPVEDDVCASDLTFWERKPFQDVTSLISGKARWRRKYDCFDDDDICGSWTCSSEDIICPVIDHQQGKLSLIPITVTDVDKENKDNDTTDEKKSSTESLEVEETEKQVSMEKTQSQTDADNQGKSNTAELENKGSGVKMIKSDIMDQGKSSTTAIHNIEAEKKG